MYFLAKTDPETYSIDNLERDRKTVWDGVRNLRRCAPFVKCTPATASSSITARGMRLWSG
jgi:hypothetical protein